MDCLSDLQISRYAGPACREILFVLHVFLVESYLCDLHAVSRRASAGNSERSDQQGYCAWATTCAAFQVSNRLLKLPLDSAVSS